MSEDIKIEDIKQIIWNIENIKKEELAQAGINVPEIIKFYKYKLKNITSMYFNQAD